MKTSDFFYELPDSSIAQTPIEPRHAARLLDTRDMTDRVFSELPGMLSSGDLVVVNRSKVRAARLKGRKADTGGAIEILLLSRLSTENWEALIRPARRVREGLRIELAADLTAEVVQAPVDGRCEVRLVGNTVDDFEKRIEEIGEVPLPPYIRTALANSDRYQTVYAGDLGSAAAPTAGLHFSSQVLRDLDQRGIGLAYVDLRVGLDTFRPISTTQIDDHQMHSEHVTVPSETCEAIASTRDRGGRVVAVGTTVVRSLESASDGAGRMQPFDGPTDLFIRPGYRFRAIDGLITNFHVPGSTLVVLIASILGDQWKAAYTTALERGYRFLSFGDAMYAEINR